jgi:LuxR family transcriptional regulator, maltose regulon positive regulatory protein
VSAGRGERDPQRFWASLAGALRRTSAGAGLVQGVSAAPDLDAWALVERLLADLAPLDDRLWLVVDDVHELDPEASRQLELLVMRAPPELRFVLAARHDVRWNRPVRSWWRWMPSGPGSATTRCSPTCCGWSCGALRRAR